MTSRMEPAALAPATLRRPQGGVHLQPPDSSGGEGPRRLPPSMALIAPSTIIANRPPRRPLAPRRGSPLSDFARLISRGRRPRAAIGADTGGVVAAPNPPQWLIHHFCVSPADRRAIRQPPKRYPTLEPLSTCGEKAAPLRHRGARRKPLWSSPHPHHPDRHDLSNQAGGFSPDDSRDAVARPERSEEVLLG